MSDMFWVARAKRAGTDLNTALRQNAYLEGGIEAYKKELAKVKQELAEERCFSLALDAQVDALLAELKKENSNNRLLQPSDSTWNTGQFAGKAKSWFRRIFERAFDKAAAERRISNPAAIRGD